MRRYAGLIALIPIAFALRARAPEDHVLESNDGAWRVVWHGEPAEPPLNEPFALQVFVERADETPAPEGIELSFDARMPAHRHGMRRAPRIVELGAGRFRVEGALLHMPGTWELYFDVTHGAITERAQQRVELE